MKTVSYFVFNKINKLHEFPKGKWEVDIGNGKKTTTIISTTTKKSGCDIFESLFFSDSFYNIYLLFAIIDCLTSGGGLVALSNTKKNSM